jgi:nucleoside-diphosphate-sugar epimerase
MSPRRILLTGGSGFVGVHLQAELAKALPESAVYAPRFEITDEAAVAQLVGEIDPDCVIHLAAIAAIAEARAAPERTWQVNLHGTLTLANATKANRPDAFFMFISSGDIYGNTFRRGIRLDEDVPVAPVNVYSATKAAADLAIGQMAAEGLRAIRVRPLNHTGPGQSNAFVVSAFAEQIARIAAGKQPPLMRVGGLMPERDFLDVRDVCAAYVACIESADRLEPGTILNIASGTPRRIGDVLDQLLAIAGVSATVETASDRLRPTDIACAMGDSSRIREVTGWAPAIPWEQTLQDVFRYWQARV